jgi:Plant transposon protein
VIRLEGVELEREGVELEKVMNVYRKMGFPGAVGSVDATHIRWHMCPVEFVHAATGKEKYPSVAFQVCLTSDGSDPTTPMLGHLAFYRSCDQCFLCNSEK